MDHVVIANRFTKAVSERVHAGKKSIRNKPAFLGGGITQLQRIELGLLVFGDNLIGSDGIKPSSFE